MTQTQTTAERIFALIFSNIGYTDGDDRTVASIAAEIDALTADNAQANQWLVNGVAKIERLEKERDEARAEAERFKTHNLHLVKTIDSNRAEDGERIAKLERLRPAAEAWEALEAWQSAERNRNATESEVFPLISAFQSAADHARAAKEAKA